MQSYLENSRCPHSHLPVLPNPSPQVCSHFIPKAALILGFTLTQVEDLALDLVELLKVALGPLLKPVKVPLGDIPSLSSINHTTHLGVISRFAGSALNPLDYVSNEDTEQYWFQSPWYWYPLRYTTCYWFPLDIESFGHRASDCNSYPSNSPSIFFIHLTVHPSKFYLSNTVATKLRATISKALQKSKQMTSIVLVH